MIFPFGRGALASHCIGLLLMATAAWAGECNCAGTNEHDDNKKQWSITLQFESMNMGTLLQGSQQVDPMQVVNQALKSPGTKSYSVPTNMIMQRSTFRARYRFDEDNALMLSLPFSVSNQMEMLMGMNPMTNKAMPAAMPMVMPAMAMPMPAEGMAAAAMPMAMPMAGPTFSSMTMKPINQMGDVSVLFQHRLLSDEDGNSLTVAGGIKFPSGDYQVRSANGRLVHAMMQPGTGSLDFLAGISGRISLGGGPDGQTWTLDPGVTYQLNGTNPLGYRFGNRFGYDLALNCRLDDSLVLTTALNGIVTGFDSQNGTLDPHTGTQAYQNPTTSLVDNVANTGGSMLYISPGFQWKISEDVTMRAHHRIPLIQRANGTQIVTDGWTTINMSVAF